MTVLNKENKVLLNPTSQLALNKNFQMKWTSSLLCWALGSIMPTILQFVQCATIDDRTSTRTPGCFLGALTLLPLSLCASANTALTAILGMDYFHAGDHPGDCGEGSITFMGFMSLSSLVINVAFGITLFYHASLF